MTEFDIRAACRNRVVYLRDAVDMVSYSFPDIEVVEKGEELGPCIYRTVFAMPVSNPEDYKEVALTVARINEFIRDVRARLLGYGWELFEKESYVDGNYVYTEARWVKKIRLPDRRYTSVMDIYELARPFIEAKLKADGMLSVAVAGTA